jgi:hypothetical protein
MPARTDAIEKYIQGKKYQQVLNKKCDYDYLEKFKEFLEQSTKKNHEYNISFIPPNITYIFKSFTDDNYFAN